MPYFHINFWAVLVATLSRMAVGMCWYSPLLFGKAWMRLSGRTPEMEREVAASSVIAGLIGSFIMALVLVHAVHYAGANSAALGAAVGFFNWAGFIAVPLYTGAIHQKERLSVTSINAGFQLAGLLAMGAILAVWV